MTQDGYTWNGKNICHMLRTDELEKSGKRVTPANRLHKLVHRNLSVRHLDTALNISARIGMGRTRDTVSTATGMSWGAKRWGLEDGACTPESCCSVQLLGIPQCWQRTGWADSGALPLWAVPTSEWTKPFTMTSAWNVGRLFEISRYRRFSDLTRSWRSVFGSSTQNVLYSWMVFEISLCIFVIAIHIQFSKKSSREWERQWRRFLHWSGMGSTEVNRTSCTHYSFPWKPTFTSLTIRFTASKSPRLPASFTSWIYLLRDILVSHKQVMMVFASMYNNVIQPLLYQTNRLAKV